MKNGARGIVLVDRGTVSTIVTCARTLRGKALHAATPMITAAHFIDVIDPVSIVVSSARILTIHAANRKGGCRGSWLRH